jgi:hypothetical protein
MLGSNGFSCKYSMPLYFRENLPVFVEDCACPIVACGLRVVLHDRSGLPEMLSRHHNCIFIHNRKCAGTSIISSFGITPDMGDWHMFNDGVLDPDWLRERDVVQSAFKFTCVRNPFDRAVSGWRYLKSISGRRLEEALENPPVTGHDFRHFTRPQSDILFDRSTGGLVVDAIVRFETLQSDFDLICDRIGLERRVLAWRNPTTRARDYRTYFNRNSRKMAETLFHADLQNFGYDF